MLSSLLFWRKKPVSEPKKSLTPVKKSITLEQRDLNIRENIKAIANVSNGHGSVATNIRLDFFHTGVDKFKFTPSTRILFELFIQLATEGGTEQLDNKKEYSRYYPKIILTKYSQPEVGFTTHGEYKYKHSLFIYTMDTSSLLPTVLHEIVHYLLYQTTKKMTPDNSDRWGALAESLKTELKPADLLTVKNPKIDRFRDHHLECYKNSWVPELPARLAEIDLIHGELLTTSDQLTEETVTEIQTLYNLFIENIKKKIQYDEKKEVSHNPLVIHKKLFHSHKKTYNELLRLADELLDAETLKSMGIYPLHIAAATDNLLLLIILLTNPKFSSQIKQLDKHQLTVLDVAASYDTARTKIFLSPEEKNVDRVVDMIVKLPALTQEHLTYVSNHFSHSKIHLEILKKLVAAFIKDDANLDTNNIMRNMLIKLTETYKAVAGSIDKAILTQSLNFIHNSLVEHQRFLSSRATARSSPSDIIKLKQDIIDKLIITLRSNQIIGPLALSSLSILSHKMSDEDSQPKDVIVDIFDPDEIEVDEAIAVKIPLLQMKPYR